MAIEQRLGNARLFGNLRCLGAFEAAFGKQPAGYAQQQFPAFFGGNALADRWLLHVDLLGCPAHSDKRWSESIS